MSKRVVASLAVICLLVQQLQVTSILPLLPQAFAAATPDCALDIVPNLSTNVGEPFHYKITLSNTGTSPGYAPFVETVLPANTTFSSAVFSVGNVTLTPESPTPTVVTDNDAGDPAQGLVTNPITGATTLLPVGSRYIVLDLPLGSYVPGQTPVDITINANLNGGLPVGTPLSQSALARCGFALGNDPLDNPNTDPVLTSSLLTATITPTVLKGRKTMDTVHGESETATGPDFPVTYHIGADIANTAVVTGISVTETVPNTLQVIDFTSISNVGPSFNLTFTPTAGAPQSTTTLPWTPTGPFLPGGTITLTVPTATGTLSDDDIRLTYRTFVPDQDAASVDVLSHATGASRNIPNNVTASGTYFATPVSHTPTDPVTLAARSLAVQKGVALTNDVGGQGISHGDTVRYTLNFQVSDYYSFDRVVLEDLMGDGLEYIPNSARLSVTEDGATNNALTFTEATVPEASVITATPPPAHDFSACAGCTLAITEDTSNNDDAVARPADGQTLLTFDVSSVIDAVGGEDGRLVGGIVQNGSAGSPTQGTITFDALILDSFVDTQANDFSIDSDDAIDNQVRITGNLVESGTPLATYAGDSSSEDIRVPNPTFQKDLIGLKPFGGVVDIEPFVAVTPLHIGSGDQVTYRFTVHIPSGNLERLVVTDYLPLPFYDSMEMDTTFDTTVYTPVDGNAASVPPAGRIAYGSNTAGITPLPTPTITKDAATNTFTVAYNDMSVFEKTPSSPTDLELFFTVTAQPKPMADNLKIVNMTTFGTDASNANSVVSSSSVAQNITKFPSMSIQKGTVATDKAGATFTPATVGPVTFAAPGAGIPFTGTAFSTTDLLATPINSNISGVDAGDKVTFAVVAENKGSANAYDLRVAETLPAGFNAPSSMVDLNLHVYDASGADRGTDTIGGLFGFVPISGGTTDGSGDSTLKFDTGVALLGHAADVLTTDGLANEGQNILIITYDLEVADSVAAREIKTNTASITQYASIPSGDNFVDPGDAPSDDATTTIADITLAKSNEDAPAGNMIYTTTGSGTEGEIIRYRLKVTLPEGTTPASTITDNIPNGLRFYKPSGVTIDTTATCTAGGFNGSLPSVSITSPTGVVGLGTNGQDLSLSLGSATTVSDNNIANNSFCLVYDLAVDTAISGPVTLTNSATLTEGSNTYGPATSAITGVEPILALTKGASPTSGDAGNYVTYTVLIEHRSTATASSADAVEIEATDVVPTKVLVDLLDPVTNFGTDGLDNDDDGATDEPDELVGAFYNAGTATFTWNTATTGNTKFTQLPLGQSMTMRFKARILSTVTPTEVVTNTANAIYGSILAVPLSGIEKAGTANGSRNVTVTNVTSTKATNGTTEATTGNARVNGSNPDLAIGEQITFRITLNVPESSLANLVVNDPLPAGLRADSAVLISDGTGSAAPTILIDDTNADLINDRARFTFASVLPPGSPSSSTATTQIIMDVTATVLNNGSNANGQTKTNTVSSTWTGQVGGAQTASTSYDIVEPILTPDKSFSSITGDAGDTTIMTVSFNQNAGTSNADAFEIAYTDTMPTGLQIDTAFGTDGVDNDNDGVTDGADAADETLLATNAFTSTTMTLNAATTGNALFTQLPQASAVVITYRAKLNVLPSVFPNQVITNTANLSWTTLPGVVTDERTKTASDNAIYTINNAGITKNVLSTSRPETGTSQLNGALTDLTIGETVTYRIAVPFPEGAATTVRVRDTMPVEIEALSGSFVDDQGVSHQFTSASLLDLVGSDGVNDTIDFNLGTVTNAPDGDSETLIFDVVGRVRNHVSVVAGSNKINTATFTFTEQIGGPLTDTAAVDIVTPNISVTKTANSASADAGDELTYTLQVTNTGSAPVYDLVVTDTPQAGIDVDTAFGTDGVDNDGDTLIDEPDEATLTLVQGSDLIWSNGNGVTAFATVLPGVSYTLRYKAVVGIGASPNATYQNTVTGVGESLPGGGGNSRQVTDNDNFTVTITDSDNIAKTLRDAVVKKRIGDVVPYRITFTVQEGTTHGLSIQDTLPAGLIMVPGSLSIATPTPADVNWNGTPTSPIIAPASATHNATSTQSLTFNFGDVVNGNTNNGATETIVIEYDAVVANIAANTHGVTRQNTASALYEGVITKGPVVAPAITVIEPTLNVDIANTYVSGDTIPYSLSLRNNSPDAVGILYDSVTRVVLPSNVTLSGSPVLVSGPGGMVITPITPDVFDIAFPTIDNTYSAGSPIVITFNGAIDTSIAPGGVKLATATMRGTSQAGSPGLLIATQNLSSERTGDTTNPGGAANTYQTADNSSITVTRPYLQTSTKELIDLNGGDLHIGDDVTYRITVANTGNLAGTGITVVDDLPEFMAPFTATLVPGGATANFTAAPAGFYGQGQLTVTPISVGIGASEVIEYSAKVQLNTPDESEAINRATISPATEGGIGKEVIVTGTILAPVLSITKVATVANGANLIAGTPIQYTVTMSNTGHAPATNVIMSDPLPIQLLYAAGSAEENTAPRTDAADGDDFSFTNSTSTVQSVQPTFNDGETIVWKWVTMPVGLGLTTNTASYVSDEGFTGQASHDVTLMALPTGGPTGGGGGFDPIPGPPPSSNPPIVGTPFKAAPIPEPISTPVEVDECVNITPVVAVNDSYCLELDSKRPVTFPDVPETHPLWPYIMTLKNTRILATGDYIASGTGNHSTGKQQAKFQGGSWPYEPDRAMTRLEVVKVAMIANCLPIDESILTQRPDAVFTDLPTNVPASDEALNFAARVFYSAEKLGIITGDRNAQARPFDKVTPQEAIAIMLRAANAVNVKPATTGDWAKDYVAFAVKYELVTAAELKEAGNTLPRDLMAKILVNSLNFNPDPAVHGYIERVDMEKQEFHDNVQQIGEKAILAAKKTDTEGPMCVTNFESCLMHEPERKLQFTDVDKTSWAAPYIDIMRTTKIIKEGDYVASGNGNQSTGRQQQKFASGTWNFEPDRYATRLEFLKVVLVTNCISVEDSIPTPSNKFSFIDLPNNTSPEDETQFFAARVMYTGYKYGLITGGSDFKARAFEPITRAEALAILQRSRVDHSSALSTHEVHLNDVGENAWFRPLVGYFIETGIVGELGNKMFRPDRPIKRSEMAKLMYDFMLLNPREDIRDYGLALLAAYNLEDTVRRVGEIVKKTSRTVVPKLEAPTVPVPSPRDTEQKPSTMQNTNTNTGTVPTETTKENTNSTTQPEKTMDTPAGSTQNSAGSPATGTGQGMASGR